MEPERHDDFFLHPGKTENEWRYQRKSNSLNLIICNMYIYSALVSALFMGTHLFHLQWTLPSFSHIANVFV